MPVDQSDIEVLRSVTFPRSWAWRGYDRAEVEKFLQALAARLEFDTVDSLAPTCASLATREL
jgi:DivIVA domain-containing protein